MAEALLELKSLPPLVWYSWLPGAGWILALNRPQDGSNDASKALKPPQPYWSSPRVSTAAMAGSFSMMFEVAICRQAADVPFVTER